MQNVLTGTKVLLMGGIVAACLWSPAAEASRLAPLLPADVGPGAMAGSVAAAMILSVFSYSGFYFVTHVAVLPFDQLAASPRVAADAMLAAVGPRAADLTAVVVLLSALGTLNAQLLNYPRITFALASDGLFFGAARRVDPVRRVPVGAIVLVGV